MKYKLTDVISMDLVRIPLASQTIEITNDLPPRELNANNSQEQFSLIPFFLIDGFL